MKGFGAAPVTTSGLETGLDGKNCIGSADAMLEFYGRGLGAKTRTWSIFPA
jgi:hypothetical protein